MEYRVAVPMQSHFLADTVASLGTHSERAFGGGGEGVVCRFASVACRGIQAHLHQRERLADRPGDPSATPGCNL